MNPLFETLRLNVFHARENEIPKIMDIENHPDNKNYIWQGSYEEHLHEIQSENSLLLTFKSKNNQHIVGYCLVKLNNQSHVFELRRIAILEKGMGFGKEVMAEILTYCFTNLNMNRFWLDVYPDNTVGINLYWKLGLVHEGTLRQSYKSSRGYLDQMIFSMLKDEYLRKIGQCN